MRLQTINEALSKDGVLAILKQHGLKKATVASGPKTGRVLTSYSKGYVIDPVDFKNLKFYGLTKEEFKALIDAFSSEGYKVEVGNDWRATPDTNSTFGTFYVRE